MTIIRSLTRQVAVQPHVAIERIFAAYDEAGGYPDGAARILGVEVSTLFKWNRKLGIKHMLRERTGHYPGWKGAHRELNKRTAACRA